MYVMLIHGTIIDNRAQPVRRILDVTFDEDDRRVHRISDRVESPPHGRDVVPCYQNA